MLIPVKCPDCGKTHFVNVCVDYTKITYGGFFRNNTRVEDKVRIILKKVRVLNVFSATSVLESLKGGRV